MACEDHEGLTFKVIRREPELVVPARPTPHEFKKLSDIDDQAGLRVLIPVLQFYPYNSSMSGRDPVTAIRRGLAEALVYYYPLAGRLREWQGKKLVVECTGEGAVFTEADADITLEQLGDTLRPPFPYLDKLLLTHPELSTILHGPLILVQVTRLRCGGFVFALLISHSMCDAYGMAQFIKAIADMTKGDIAPSVLPVWNRELLQARDPLCVTCEHHEFDEVPGYESVLVPLYEMCHRYFTFGASEISAIRRSLPQHLQRSSAFDVITAFLWCCHAATLNLHPDDKVRVIVTVNARNKFNPPLLKGYYGNAFATPVAIASAGELCRKPLGFALELIRKTKASVTDEYLRSFVDHIVAKGKPVLTLEKTFLCSDTRLGFAEVDFGWGKPKYGGPAAANMSYYITYKNKDGENEIVVPIGFPTRATMDRFVEEVNTRLGIGKESEGAARDKPKSVLSSL